jgi:4'-phosphopantetheinyl transferase
LIAASLWLNAQGEDQLYISADSGVRATHRVLPGNEVHIWHADLGVKQDYISSLLELLDRDEQQRASRFKVAASREQFVVSRAFLRLALAQYLQIEPADVRFRIAANGKPELGGGENIRFNLSHTDGAAALAITRDRAVGIDVERVRDNVDAIDLAGRFFSTAEAEWLRSQPASERIQAFFSCWTAKEAFLKACGTGFSRPLAGFTVIPNPRNEKLQVETFSDRFPESWSICKLNFGPELSTTLAVQGTDLTVRCGRWVWPVIKKMCAPSNDIEKWPTRPGTRINGHSCCAIPYVHCAPLTA